MFYDIVQSGCNYWNDFIDPIGVGLSCLLIVKLFFNKIWTLNLFRVPAVNFVKFFEVEFSST